MKDQKEIQIMRESSKMKKKGKLIKIIAQK